MTVSESFLTEKLVYLSIRSGASYFFCIFKKLGILLEFVHDNVFAMRGK